MADFVVLDAKTHGKVKVKPDHQHKHVAKQQMVPLFAAEFMKASINFPIFFVKQEQTGDFKPVALMGTEAGENLIFTGSKINSYYLPANVRRYPFAAGGADKYSDELVICIDQSSDWLNSTEGFSLFSDDGKPSDELNRVGKMLVDILAKDQATDGFVSCLQSFDLLERADIKLTIDNTSKTLSGIYKVNEEKLAELADSQVLELHKKHYLPAIHAHLSSLNQINKLLMLKRKQATQEK